MPQIGTTNTGQPSIVETFDVSLYTYLSPLLPYMVYVGHIPEEAKLPAFSYFQLDEDPDYTLAGNASGYDTVTYQIDAWSTKIANVTVMQRNLKDVLHGFNGMMGITRVWNSRIVTSSIGAENTSDQSDYWIYHGVTEVRFSYKENVPDFNVYPTPTSPTVTGQSKGVDILNILNIFGDFS